MPAGPQATEHQLKQIYHSIRQLDHDTFITYFDAILDKIQTLDPTQAELAFGIEFQNKHIASIGDPTVNEKDAHGNIARFYSHDGTDYALHFKPQTGLETHHQLRALLLCELADAIDNKETKTHSASN